MARSWSPRTQRTRGLTSDRVTNRERGMGFGTTLALDAGSRSASMPAPRFASRPLVSGSIAGAPGANEPPAVGWRGEMAGLHSGGNGAAGGRIGRMGRGGYGHFCMRRDYRVIARVGRGPAPRRAGAHRRWPRRGPTSRRRRAAGRAGCGRHHRRRCHTLLGQRAYRDDLQQRVHHRRHRRLRERGHVQIQLSLPAGYLHLRRHLRRRRSCRDERAVCRLCELHGGPPLVERRLRRSPLNALMPQAERLLRRPRDVRSVGMDSQNGMSSSPPNASAGSSATAAGPGVASPPPP